jgi:predicted phosphodiesterase
MNPLTELHPGRLTLPPTQTTTHVSLPPGPLLVFGGPYSNLRATQALRDEADRLALPPERVICTGDVVAYCAEPEETTQLVRDWGCHVIAGNCEEQLAEGADDCGCGFDAGSACDILAKGWYPYANARISTESRAWMASLPKHLTFQISGITMRVVHGGVDIVNQFLFASQTDAIKTELAKVNEDVVIAGHAGLPFVAKGEGKVWFNPGVIGMPANDGTAEVWYGLVEPITGLGVRLTTHRLLYDHNGAAAAMRRAAYADGYAKSLITGLWPSLDILPPTEAAAIGKRRRPKSIVVPVKVG